MNRAGLGAINVMILFTRELGKILHLLLIVMNYYFSTAPNTSPMNVRAIRTTATVIMVSWRPLTLTEARGFISHYTVTYSPQVISGGRKRQAAMTEVVTGMDANMTSIDGLDPDAVYNVQVSAATAAGNGAISIVVSVPQGICLIVHFSSEYRQNIWWGYIGRQNKLSGWGGGGAHYSFTKIFPVYTLSPFRFIQA